MASVGLRQCGLAKSREASPELVVELAEGLFEQIGELDRRVAELDRVIRRRTHEREALQRLMTIPGMGPMRAMAVQAFTPPMEQFRCRRDHPDGAA